MNMNTTTQTQTRAQAQATASAIPSIVGTAALGLFLIFVAGFAQNAVAHDTAHDVRHAIGFACH